MMRQIDLRIDVAAPVVLGGPLGKRRFIAITGGSASGAVEGKILPGGADWQTVRPDGTVEIDAQYVLETGDSGRVELRSMGLRRQGADRFSSVFFATTDAPSLAWLNDHLFLADGQKSAGTVVLTLRPI